ncbi:MAG: 50S ribosomal protein L31e [Candidatus Aenigmarchaeota archaeon]|nr:50S ribosomal protein L31e [Candidatus Aenigmarchaeota archaeon]
MAEKSKPGEEKIVTIPLRHESRKSAKNMRMNRSVRTVREFLSRHMRTEPSKVMISQQLNESLWKGGVHNPPSKIKVKVSTGEEGKVFASLIDEKEGPKIQKKKLSLRERLARRKEDAGKKPDKPTSTEKAEEKAKAAAKEKPEEKKEEKTETKKEKPPKKETAPEEMEQDILLDE